MNNHKVNHSNRGAALLSVVIVMTIVAVLGALIMSVAYTNLRMKVVDKKSKDNFYSAESIMEELMAGLQAEVSEQYKEAYTTVAENYGNYSSEAEMQEDFATQFVLNMVDKLRTVSSPTTYDITKLKAYVSVAERQNAVTSDRADIQTLEDGLSLKNVTVAYDNDGYYNKITTDIKILIPDVAFSFISDMPEIADYALIAQEGMEVTGFGKIEGKAFFGRETEGTNADVSVLIDAGSGLSTNDAASSLIVSEGEISLNGSGTFETGEITSLWTDMITANGNGDTIKILGRTYVKDDVTLEGDTGTLVIGGQYYGYSNNDTNASQSSAIIINGQDTSLNMSDVSTMVISGTSFVAVQGEPSSYNTNDKDVLLGDSIAIKSNQVAYLVPTECRGVETNPMTYDQYNTLITNPNWREDIRSSYVRTLGRSIASYDTAVSQVDIVPVFTNRSGGAVYLYLGFPDSDIASKYFMDYYGQSSRIKNYINEYIKMFEFADSDQLVRLVTQGNYLIDSSSSSYTAGYDGNTGDVGLSAQEMVNYQRSFQALCTKLVTNMSAVSSEEESKTVYENLINEDKIEELFTKYAAAAGTVENVTVTGNVATITPSTAAGATLIKAILVDNDGDSDSAYNFSESGSGIVIATGDVTVNSSSLTAWDGLIICGGHLKIVGATKDAPRVLKANADSVSKAMQLECTTGTDKFSVKNFFVGGENFTSNEVESDSDGSSDIRKCLIYENWKTE